MSARLATVACDRRGRARCAAARPRRTDAPDVDGAARPGAARPRRPTTLADRPWGELFRRQGARCADRARRWRTTPTCAIAAERVELARAQFGFQRSLPVSRRSASRRPRRASARRSGQRRRERRRANRRSLGLAVPTWEIDLWGRVRAATEAARRQLLATEETRRALPRQHRRAGRDAATCELLEPRRPARRSPRGPRRRAANRCG